MECRCCEMAPLLLWLLLHDSRSWYPFIQEPSISEETANLYQGSEHVLLEPVSQEIGALEVSHDPGQDSALIRE